MRPGGGGGEGGNTEEESGLFRNTKRIHGRKRADRREIQIHGGRKHRATFRHTIHTYVRARRYACVARFPQATVVPLSTHIHTCARTHTHTPHVRTPRTHVHVHTCHSHVPTRATPTHRLHTYVGTVHIKLGGRALSFAAAQE